MKVALRVGPEIQNENKGFIFSIDRGTPFFLLIQDIMDN